jgi:hypothetical protein
MLTSRLMRYCSTLRRMAAAGNLCKSEWFCVGTVARAHTDQS